MQCRRPSAKRRSFVPEKTVLKKAQEEDEKLSTVGDAWSADDVVDEIDEEQECSDATAEKSHVEGLKREDYVARLPQRLIPCMSYYSALADLLFGVAGARIKTARARELQQSDEVEEGLYVV